MNFGLFMKKLTVEGETFHPTFAKSAIISY